MPPTFSTECAYRVLERACESVGEIADGATLLRMGENAIFRLGGRSDSIVVRIPRDLTRMDVAQRELCVSRWLNGSGRVPTTQVHEAIAAQPIVVHDHPITFWRFVEPAAAPPTVGDLGTLLVALHSAEDSPCNLPAFDPLSSVRERIKKGLKLGEADIAFLRSRCNAVERRLPALEYVLTAGPIHGDAHTGNLLGGAGIARLADLEMFAIGPREWDLVPLAVAVDHFGVSATQWDLFVTRYGFDIRAWSGYPVLREVRELGMVTWLAQNIGEHEAIAKEVALRIQSMRDGDTGRAWTAF